MRDRLIANEPLGVGALSYVGALTIGVVADRDAYPDLDMFVTGARQTLETLGVSVHAILMQAVRDFILTDVGIPGEVAELIS